MATWFVERLPAKAAGFFAVGGLFGGIAASSCCALPLALAGLGIGGAWLGNLAALEPYGPAFLLFAFASLGLGFYRVRRSAAACEVAGACPDPAGPNGRRLVRGALWAGVALVAFAAAFPYALPVLLG
jgi:mercuric ion transport protein